MRKEMKQQSLIKRINFCAQDNNLEYRLRPQSHRDPSLQARPWKSRKTCKQHGAPVEPRSTCNTLLILTQLD